MQLKQFDDVVALCVDHRYDKERERIEDIFAARCVEPRWFIDGAGELFEPKMYSQFHTQPPRTWQDGFYSWQHFRAFKKMIEQAKSQGCRHILIAEDDLILAEEFDEVVDKLNFPDDWDMFYYGANHTDKKTRQEGDHILRCFGAACTHLVAFRETIYDAVMALPMDRTIDWNIANRLHDKFHCYAAWPNIALQKPGFSSLWKRPVDYTELFKSKGEPV